MKEEDEFDEPEPTFDRDYSNIIIIDGIPQVPAKKIPKLSKFLIKVFTKEVKQLGTIVDIEIPGPEAGAKKSPGYCFIEFSSKKAAAAAVKAKDHKKLDSKHTMRVSLFSSYDPDKDSHEKYSPPPPSEYTRESKNLRGWLVDDFGRDQLALRFGKETHVVWNDPIRRNNEQQHGAELYYGGERQKAAGRKGQPGCWTEKYVHWSPKGSYLATFHNQGILLWGGADFEEIARFEHRNVAAIDFSPCEKFLVTTNFKEKKSSRDQDCFIVWDITKLRGGRREGVVYKRGFAKGASTAWPAFVWSHDDKYFARVGENMISVYETPSFKMLNNRSIKVNGVREVRFSPKSHIISYWLPEKKNQPATVSLVAIPSRKRVSEKHLYTVQNIQMYWQNLGDYLCVKLSRRKSKKTYTTNFELFRMNEPNIPVEVLQLSDPEVLHFAWQPNGRMFGVIHAKHANDKPTITFYNIKKRKTQAMYTLTNADTLTQTSFDRLVWSPAGHYCVLTSMQAGKLEFFQVKKKQSMDAQDHFKMTDVRWCPSGRYVVSMSCQPLDKSWAYASANGYKIWTCQGELLINRPINTLYQVLWRPRPRSLLSAKEKSDIKKNLKKKYWDQYEAEMLRIKQSTSTALTRQQLALKNDWKTYRAECEQQYADEQETRKTLRGEESDNEDDYEVVETVVQTLISIDEEPL